MISLYKRWLNVFLFIGISAGSDLQGEGYLVGSYGCAGRRVYKKAEASSWVKENPLLWKQCAHEADLIEGPKAPTAPFGQDSVCIINPTHTAGGAVVVSDGSGTDGHLVAAEIAEYMAQELASNNVRDKAGAQAAIKKLLQHLENNQKRLMPKNKGADGTLSFISFLPEGEILMGNYGDSRILFCNTKSPHITFLNESKCKLGVVGNNFSDKDLAVNFILSLQEGDFIIVMSDGIYNGLSPFDVGVEMSKDEEYKKLKEEYTRLCDLRKTNGAHHKDFVAKNGPTAWPSELQRISNEIKANASIREPLADRLRDRLTKENDARVNEIMSEFITSALKAGKSASEIAKNLVQEVRSRKVNLNTSADEFDDLTVALIVPYTGSQPIDQRGILGLAQTRQKQAQAHKKYKKVVDDVCAQSLDEFEKDQGKQKKYP